MFSKCCSFKATYLELLLPWIKSMISLSPILLYFQLSTSHFNFLDNFFYIVTFAIFWAINFFFSFCKYVCALQFDLATCILLMRLWIVSFTYKLVKKVEGTSFFLSSLFFKLVASVFLLMSLQLVSQGLKNLYF